MKTGENAYVPNPNYAFSLRQGGTRGCHLCPCKSTCMPGGKSAEGKIDFLPCEQFILLEELIEVETDTATYYVSQFDAIGVINFGA